MSQWPSRVVKCLTNTGISEFLKLLSIICFFSSQLWAGSSETKSFHDFRDPEIEIEQTHETRFGYFRALVPQLEFYLTHDPQFSKILTAEEKRVWEKLVTYLQGETATITMIENDAFFMREHELDRFAVTGPGKFDPILFNEKRIRDLGFKLDMGTIFQILVHEFSHKVKNQVRTEISAERGAEMSEKEIQAIVDALGVKFAMRMQNYLIEDVFENQKIQRLLVDSYMVTPEQGRAYKHMDEFLVFVENAKGELRVINPEVSLRLADKRTISSFVTYQFQKQEGYVKGLRGLNFRIPYRVHYHKPGTWFVDKEMTNFFEDQILNFTIGEKGWIFRNLGYAQSVVTEKFVVEKKLQNAKTLEVSGTFYGEIKKTDWDTKISEPRFFLSLDLNFDLSAFPVEAHEVKWNSQKKGYDLSFKIELPKGTPMENLSINEMIVDQGWTRKLIPLDQEIKWPLVRKVPMLKAVPRIVGFGMASGPDKDNLIRISSNKVGSSDSRELREVYIGLNMSMQQKQMKSKDPNGMQKFFATAVFDTKESFKLAMGNLRVRYAFANPHTQVIEQNERDWIYSDLDVVFTDKEVIQNQLPNGKIEVLLPLDPMMVLHRILGVTTRTGQYTSKMNISEGIHVDMVLTEFNLMTNKLVPLGGSVKGIPLTMSFNNLSPRRCKNLFFSPQPL